MQEESARAMAAAKAAEETMREQSAEEVSSDKALLYFFPDIKIELKDGTIAAQCTIFVPDDTNSKAEIADEAFQQNWHWKNANETASQCNYEILVSDFMTRTLDYKTRLNLFMNFLAAVTKATKPQVIYSVGSQKLIAPDSRIESRDGQEKKILFGIANVRLFNISNSDTEDILMDTVGLSNLGLPDFQIRFTSFDERKVADWLWNYAYYIFEQGDIIESGNTLLGLEALGPSSVPVEDLNFRTSGAFLSFLYSAIFLVLLASLRIARRALLSPVILSPSGSLNTTGLLSIEQYGD